MTSTGPADHNSSDEREGVRLSPPPRIGPVENRKALSRIDPDSGGRPWGSVILLLLLAGAAAAVFLGLPSWVATSRSAPSPSSSEAVADAVVPLAEESPTQAEPPAPAEPPAAGPETERTTEDRDGETAAPVSQTPRETARARAPVPGPATNSGAREQTTRGLDALRRQAYEEAVEAFQQVLSRDPSSSEGAEGLALAEAGLKRELVARHRVAAEAQEEAEAWAQAKANYDAILAVDGALGFAQTGRSRAEERHDLDRRLRYHLGHPDRLSYDEVLEEVDDLLQEARSIPLQGPLLTSQIAQLQGLARAYRGTVMVRLESDELTDVMLHRVGRLGRFLTRELNLRPGVYTLVGSRDGYRDVRLKLRVDPKAKDVSQDIRCREAI